jgi:hypothetical protein
MKTGMLADGLDAKAFPLTVSPPNPFPRVEPRDDPLSIPDTTSRFSSLLKNALSS